MQKHDLECNKNVINQLIINPSPLIPTTYIYVYVTPM